MQQQWISHSESETLELGRRLAAQLPEQAVVSLEGTLGAGKSVLVRGLAMGLGIDPEQITSPTFTLWQTYSGQRILHHLDAYRLNDVHEFRDLGADELFMEGGLILIEWGDKVRKALPPDCLRLEIEVIDATTRRIKLSNVSD